MAQARDFGFGSEEQMVRDAARKLLREQAPIESLRTLVARDPHAAYEGAQPPAVYDERLWRQMVELGWCALAVPESAGGAGMKTVAVTALAEEIGRAALPSPLPSTLAATAVLAALDGAAASAGAWLARIAAGESATLAVVGGDAAWEGRTPEVTATLRADGALLRGTAWFVQDARKAGFFVVGARAADGIALCAVPADAPGLRVEPDRIVDLTRDQARLVLDDVVVGRDAVLAGPAEGGPAIAAALPTVLTITAADLCGAAEWQLQTTTEYARVRTQFDRPIGFFQAVKHPIVNMMVEVDRARSLTYAAAAAIDGEPDAALRLARMAKAAASDAAAFCASRSVQLHGGIGFTWECDVHLYFKRQKHGEFLWGDGRYQRARLAAILDG